MSPGGTDNEQTREDRATQPMEARGWVSQYAVLILWRKKGVPANFYAFCISVRCAYPESSIDTDSFVRWGQTEKTWRVRNKHCWKSTFNSQSFPNSNIGLFGCYAPSCAWVSCFKSSWHLLVMNCDICMNSKEHKWQGKTRYKAQYTDTGSNCEKGMR